MFKMEYMRIKPPLGQVNSEGLPRVCNNNNNYIVIVGVQFSEGPSNEIGCGLRPDRTAHYGTLY